MDGLRHLRVGRRKHDHAGADRHAAIELDDQSVDPYLVLAASSAVLGRTEEARWATGKVLNLKPGFRLAELAASQPYREQKRLVQFLDQLTSAGLA